MNVKIRLAEHTEIDWINKKYSEIGFQQVLDTNETIAAAEIDTQKKSGVARLVRLDKDSLELASGYVLEAYRNKGVTGKLIEFLISH